MLNLEDKEKTLQVKSIMTSINLIDKEIQAYEQKTKKRLISDNVLSRLEILPIDYIKENISSWTEKIEDYEIINSLYTSKINLVKELKMLSEL